MLQDVHSQALSRRSFLVTTGAFSIAVAFGTLPDAGLCHRRIRAQCLGDDW